MIFPPWCKATVQFSGPGETPRSVTSFGGNSEGVTPLPIPNREVKPLSADGTWLERAWESRSPPALIERAVLRGGPFLVVEPDRLTPVSDLLSRPPSASLLRRVPPRALETGRELQRELDRDAGLGARHPRARAQAGLLGRAHRSAALPLRTIAPRSRLGARAPTAAALDRGRMRADRGDLREQEDPLGRRLRRCPLDRTLVLPRKLEGAQGGEVGGDSKPQPELFSHVAGERLARLVVFVAPEHSFAQARNGFGRNIRSASGLAARAVKPSHNGASACNLGASISLQKTQNSA